MKKQKFNLARRERNEKFKAAQETREMLVLIRTPYQDYTVLVPVPEHALPTEIKEKCVLHAIKNYPEVKNIVAVPNGLQLDKAENLEERFLKLLQSGPEDFFSLNLNQEGPDVIR